MSAIVDTHAETVYQFASEPTANKAYDDGNEGKYEGGCRRDFVAAASDEPTDYEEQYDNDVCSSVK